MLFWSSFWGVRRKGATEYAKKKLGVTHHPTSKLRGSQAHSAGFIGNDSGLLHLATWTRSPSVGFYSATTPALYGPVHQDRFLALQSPETAEAVKGSILDFFDAQALV